MAGRDIEYLLKGVDFERLTEDFVTVCKAVIPQRMGSGETSYLMPGDEVVSLRRQDQSNVRLRLRTTENNNPKYIDFLVERFHGGEVKPKTPCEDPLSYFKLRYSR